AARWRVFLARDTVGAARTPVRLAAGILTLTAAGGLLALAAAPGLGAPLGAIAGLLLFAGLGPVTDGVRHAANIAGDLPLYGLSDGSLLAHHSLFPLVLTLAIVGGVATAGFVSAGFGIGAASGTIVGGLLALLVRIAHALKGPLPPALLAPIPTPFGDLGGAVRLLWAVDGIVLCAGAGVAASILVTAPVAAIAMGAVMVAIVAHRWRNRR
ncbi:hypothetical protein ACFP59_13570, partial [Microbacterium koreense]